MGQNSYVGLETDEEKLSRRPGPPEVFNSMVKCGYKMTGGRLDFDPYNNYEKEKKARGRGVPTKGSMIPTAIRTMNRGVVQSVKEVDPDAPIEPCRARVPGKPRAQGVVPPPDGIPSDVVRREEKTAYEKRLPKEFPTMSVHSDFYFRMNRARAQAGSTIFVEPMYENRPQTAPVRSTYQSHISRVQE